MSYCIKTNVISMNNKFVTYSGTSIIFLGIGPVNCAIIGCEMHSVILSYIRTYMYSKCARKRQLCNRGTVPAGTQNARNVCSNMI